MKKLLGIIFCSFFILKTRELRNKFIEETKGMNKSEREKVYEVYNK